MGKVKLLGDTAYLKSTTCNKKYKKWTQASTAARSPDSAGLFPIKVFEFTWYCQMWLFLRFEIWDINPCQPLLYVIFLNYSFFFSHSRLVFLPLSNASLAAISLGFHCSPGTNKAPPVPTVTIQVCLVQSRSWARVLSLMPETERTALPWIIYLCLSWFAFKWVASNLPAKTSTLCYSSAFPS